MNIYRTIRNETASKGEKYALIDDELSITYSELFRAAENMTCALKDAGVVPFDRVALLSHDSIDYIVVSLAVLSLRAVVVPISPEQSEAETKNILDDISVNYLLFEKDVYSSECSLPLDAGEAIKGDYYIKRFTPSKSPPRDEYENIGPAFIRYSSGTTGKSKGVVLSHRSIIERTDAVDVGLRITGDDTVVWVLSMSFHFIATILLFLRRGATIVLCGKRFPEALIDGITRRNGTFIYATPFHYMLLANSRFVDPAAFRNVRMAVSTAMKLTTEIARAFRAKFDIELAEAYGIMEVGLPFINVSASAAKRGSVGQAMPDYEVSIAGMDKDGVGHIMLRGKGLFDAYFSPWQPRQSVLVDGWFKTGDIGSIDVDGFLRIAGREKDVINFSGMKVFACEVEEVLNSHPFVLESLVYGRLHPWYGQLPAAKVVLKVGMDADHWADDLRAFCYRKLAKYKVPKEFEFVASLPKTPTGKIKR